MVKHNMLKKRTQHKHIREINVRTKTKIVIPTITALENLGIYKSTRTDICVKQTLVRQQFGLIIPLLISGTDQPRGLVVRVSDY